MPRFTVLLPTHAHPRTLGLSIESILAQTERDFELFVVGDGCDRDSAAIVSGFGDSRIRFFDLEKAAGVGYRNRNIALREASGELIAHATDDDILFPKHLELLAAQFATPRIQWAHCRPLYVTTAGLLIPEFATLKLPHARRTFMEHANLLPSGCIVHRRACLDAAGYFNEDLEEAGDWDLWRRIVTACGPQAIGFQRRPTMLHFNTDRRVGPAAEQWPKGLAYLQAIARHSSAWPDALTLVDGPVGADVLLQQIVSDRMRDDPGYPRKIAAAVELLQDHVAWTAARQDALV